VLYGLLNDVKVTESVYDEVKSGKKIKLRRMADSLRKMRLGIRALCRKKKQKTPCFLRQKKELHKRTAV